MQVYAISCTFKPEKDSEPVLGLAICKDPDTPETFIYPNGRPLIADEIWSYKLHHTMPWSAIEVDWMLTEIKDRP
jgi:hypothetical protein